MKLPTFAGAAAAALLAVALGAPMANAADTRTTSQATPTVASDCWWSHYYDGYWHHHSKLLCEHDYAYQNDNDDYYYRLHPHFNGGERWHDHDGIGRTGRMDNDAGRVADNTDRGATDNRSAAERGTSDTANTGRAGNATDRGSGNTPNGSDTGTGTGSNSGGTFRR